MTCGSLPPNTVRKWLSNQFLRTLSPNQFRRPYLTSPVYPDYGSAFDTGRNCRRIAGYSGVSMRPIVRSMSESGGKKVRSSQASLAVKPDLE